MMAMLKNKSLEIVCLSVITLLTSCTCKRVPVEITMPGPMKLEGISKIAIVDFNSLNMEAATAKYEANKETVELTQQFVTSAFNKNKFYKVSSLDVEFLIKGEHPDTKLFNRFDALIYGHVWWQVGQEISGEYPKVFNLEKWKNVKYKAGEDHEGNPIYERTKVTTCTEDKLFMLPYRAIPANLMLSLTMYRLDRNGKVEKVTEAYSVVNHELVINNGEFADAHQVINYDALTPDKIITKLSEGKSVYKSGFDFRSVTDEFKNMGDAVKEALSSTGEKKAVVRKSSKKLPTTLEEKVVLNRKLTADLISKISPYKLSMNIEIDFDDDKIQKMLENKAYYATRRYILNEILANGNYEAENKFRSLDFDEACTVVLKSQNQALSMNEVSEAKNSFVKSKSDEIFAMGLCEEAIGNFDKSLCIYRYLFSIAPDQRTALGISRSRLALGVQSQVNEQVYEKIKARNKTNLR